MRRLILQTHQRASMDRASWNRFDDDLAAVDRIDAQVRRNSLHVAQLVAELIAIDDHRSPEDSVRVQRARKKSPKSAQPYLHPTIVSDDPLDCGGNQRVDVTPLTLSCQRQSHYDPQVRARSQDRP